MAAPPTEVAGLLVAGQAPRVVTEAWLVTSSGRTAVRLMAGGSVTVDRGQVWRRSISCGLHPDTDPTLLRLRGYRLHVRRGVVAPDGREHWAGLGLFRLTDVSRDRSTGVYQVQGKSGEYEIARAEFLSPRAISGVSTIEAVRSLVVEAVPDAIFSASVSTDETVPTVVHETDRWRAIDGDDASLARSIGAEVFCDGDGQFILADIPTLDDEPAYRIASGAALVSLEESWTEDGVANVVVATGERVDGNGPVPWGRWWDDNPGSPTYVGDVAHRLLSRTTTVEELLASGLPTGERGFGVSVTRLASPLLKTNLQCAKAAATRGKDLQGVQKRVSFSAVLNPWADVRDVVDIGGERHIIDRLTIPLSEATMQAETRSGSE